MNDDRMCVWVTACIFCCTNTDPTDPRMNKPNQLFLRYASSILTPCWKLRLMQLIDTRRPEQCPPRSSFLRSSHLITGCTLTYQASCFPPWKPPNQQEIKVAPSGSHLVFSFSTNILLISLMKIRGVSVIKLWRETSPGKQLLIIPFSKFGKVCCWFCICST